MINLPIVELDMTRKYKAYQIEHPTFAGEDNVYVLRLNPTDYDWTDKVATIVWSAKGSTTGYESAQITPVDGVVSMTVTSAWVSDGFNKIQLNIYGTDGVLHEQSPIVEWYVLQSLPATDPAPERVDIIADLIAQTATAVDSLDVALDMTTSVETLDPALPATVNLDKSGNTWELQLGLPQGIQGEPGIQGIQGLQGEQGADGITISVNEVEQVNGNISITLDDVPDGATRSLTELADVRVSYDGTTYATAGDAVRGQISSIESRLEGNVDEVFDLVEYDFNEGYFINAKGAVVAFSNEPGWCVSDFIPAIPGDKFFYKSYMGYGNSIIAFYKADGTFISSVKGGSGKAYYDGTAIAPPETAKIKFAAITAFQAKFFLKKRSGFGLKATKLKFNPDLSDLSDSLRASFEPCAFDYIELDFTREGFVSKNNGVFASYSNVFCTDYIDISGYNSLNVTGSAWSNVPILYFYNNLKYPISCYPDKDSFGNTGVDVVGENVTIPDDAVYVVVCDLHDYHGSPRPYLQSSLRYHTAYKSKYVAKEWEGKKWVCVGDSLTDVNSRTTKHYFDYVAEKTGIETVNMGVSGSGYKKRYDNNNAFYQRISNVPTDADVVTIFGSFNDNSFCADSLGNPSDTGTDTICGCINKTINNLYAVLPTVQLGIVAPTPWGTISDSNTSGQYVEALKQICAKRGIPFLDLYHCSGLRPWDATFRQLAYSKDEGSGVHPDETGHKMIAPHFKSFLDTLIL